MTLTFVLMVAASAVVAFGVSWYMNRNPTCVRCGYPTAIHIDDSDLDDAETGRA